MTEPADLSAVERVKARALEILAGASSAWTGPPPPEAGDVSSKAAYDRWADHWDRAADSTRDQISAAHVSDDQPDDTIALPVSIIDVRLHRLAAAPTPYSAEVTDNRENYDPIAAQIEDGEEDLDPPAFRSPGAFQPYVEADLAEFVIEGAVGAAPDALLHPMITRILEVESPAHYETVVERLREHWGMGRAREPTRVHLLRSIERLATRPEIACERLDAGTDLFLALAGATVTPRALGIRGARNVRHIADAELREGVLVCAAREGAVIREELIRASREAFGYRRSGHEIYSAFDRAIDGLLAEQRLVENWGQLRLP